VVKVLRPVLIVIVAVTLLSVLYAGIPAGRVQENIEIIETGDLHVPGVGKGALGIDANTARVRLNSGEVVTLSTKRAAVPSGNVLLNRRFSLFQMRYVYSLYEHWDSALCSSWQRNSLLTNKARS
jgi:hypothetical protein